MCVCCRQEVLNLSDNLDKLGPINWKLALCLAAIWVICYFCVWKGVKTTGKVSGNHTNVTCVRLHKSRYRYYNTMFYINCIGLPICGFKCCIKSSFVLNVKLHGQNTSFYRHVIKFTRDLIRYIAEYFFLVCKHQIPHDFSPTLLLWPHPGGVFDR